MKTVGVIGGLGPKTSAEFGLEIINLCVKKNKKQRPPILSWNIPLPLKIEEEVITKNKGEKKYLPFLVNAAKILEKAGPDFLVMPCNTMHIFIEEIRKSVSIPIVSIVDETILEIKKRKISKVGILATSTTISKDLFQTKLQKKGIKVITPNSNQQKKIDRLIYNLVMDKQTPKNQIVVDQVLKDLEDKGVKNIILACTDLQLLIKEKPGMEILDTMHILAKATVREILKEEVNKNGNTKKSNITNPRQC